MKPVRLLVVSLSLSVIICLVGVVHLATGGTEGKAGFSLAAVIAVMVLGAGNALVVAVLLEREFRRQRQRGLR